jgi:xylan 1,4-beta-xylosidase
LAAGVKIGIGGQTTATDKMTRKKNTTALLAVFLIGIASMSAQETAPALPVRVIAADFNVVKGQRSEGWRECIGAGRANEGLRADWQRQLKMCQDEIGFRQIRFHGLLHDDMGVYAETKDGQPVHNWQYIDELYDSLLALNIRPFVELGFMPSALASGKKKMFWWQGNVTPPKSYEKWDGLIEDLVRHWTGRYGADEVRKWNFEIWNEPNYPGFWGPRNPDKPKEEYFELYAHTAAAVKKVDAAYHVGGPAGAGPDWVRDQIHFCASNSVPLDFISYHAYGLGDGPSGLDQFGDRFLYLSQNLHSPADIANSQRAVIDASPLPHLPIHVTEWSSSYSPRDPVHDSYFSAPYILEQLKRTEQGIASMSYWTFTDIFEENGPPPSPFHGGFGLLNLQGIKKPAYFAYQFLNQLGKTELKNHDAQSWVCRDEHGGVQILCWNLTALTDGKASNQEVFRKTQPASHVENVQIKLAHVPAGNYHAQFFRVGFEKNDAYTAYLKMGAPRQLTRNQAAQLKATASGSPDEEKDISVDTSGNCDITLVERANDVGLVKLNRK